jgi:hypothetical protein
MRPAWRCRNCAAPWPCGQAKLDLLDEFAGHSLARAVYLATMLEDAVADLRLLGREPDRAVLTARFLRWSREAERARRRADLSTTEVLDSCGAERTETVHDPR